MTRLICVLAALLFCGAASAQGSIEVYRYDPASGIYVGPDKAAESPLEPGVYHDPKHTTREAAPELSEHEAAIWDGEKWSVVPDFRGSKVYSKQDGTPAEIKELGPIPEGYTPTPKPGEFHGWQDGKGWVENEAAKDEAAAEIARKSEIRQDEATANLRSKIEEASVDQIKAYINDTFPNLSEEQRKVILGLVLLSVD